MDWEPKFDENEYCRKNCEFMTEFKTLNSQVTWCELYEQKLVRGIKSDSGEKFLCCDKCFEEKTELKFLESLKK